MKIVKPSHEILFPQGPYQHIEKIGRICYKSEDAITDRSAEPFVRRLFNSGHHAMLEHFRFIIELGKYDYAVMIDNKYRKYLTFTDDNGRYIVSASARGLNDIYMALKDNVDPCNYLAMDMVEYIVHLIIKEYGCTALFYEDLVDSYNENTEFITLRVIKDFDELSDTEYKMHAWYSIHFVCDRGVTHEMVRHRDASFAQESTRYCNYSKGKYGGELTVIEPCFFDKDSDKYVIWQTGCMYAEVTYNGLIKLGAVPQEARSVLPNSLKTEIVITAQVYEWNHIFNLRVLGKTGAPHPQIKEVMEPAFIEMKEKGLV